MIRRQKSLTATAIVFTLLALLLAACAPASAPSQPAPAAPASNPATSSPAAPAAPATPAPAAPAQAEPTGPAFDAEAHYKGKRITMLVTSAAGGSPDTHARILAQLLTKYLPGNPTVIVENQAGGGGVVAGNSFYHTAKPDGYALLFGSPTLQISQLFPDAGTEYNMTEMPPLIGFSETVVTYGSAARIKTPQDVYRAQEPLFAVARGATSFATIELLSSLDILEANFRAVTYPGGTSEARPAVLRGEADIMQEQPITAFTTLQPEIDAKNVTMLWQAGMLAGGKVVADPRGGGLPTFNEFYAKVAGRPLTPEQEKERLIMAGFSSLTRFISAPPGTPEEIRAVLAEALMQAATDPEYVERTALNGIPVAVVNAADATEASRLIVEMPPELVAKHNERLNRAQ